MLLHRFLLLLQISTRMHRELKPLFHRPFSFILSEGIRVARSKIKG